MAKIAIKGNAGGTGTVTLEAPNTNIDRTVSMPDIDGQIVVNNQTVPLNINAAITENGVGMFAQGQTWQNVTGSRAWGVTYTNTTGKPIAIMSQPDTAVSTSTTLTVDGVIAWASVATASDTSNIITAVIPAGATYVITRTAGTANLVLWTELRD